MCAVTARHHLSSAADPAALWVLAQRAAAAAALAALLPLFAALYPLVRLTSPGPFLYRQKRPGRFGVPFMALKIRTMRPGADRNPALARSTSNSSPEVTRVGRVLRQLKLDELPQLWNVVRGEMALVGPRPIAFPLFEELRDKIPGFAQRLNYLPGLTNLSQVCIEENADQERVVEDWRLRFEGELHYFRNRSVAYDVVIVGLTALYIVRKVARLGAKAVPGLRPRAAQFSANP